MVLKTKSKSFCSFFPFLLFSSYNNEIEGFSLPRPFHTSMIPQNPLSLLLLLIFLLASVLPLSSSLSSVAIGEASNQTIICALTGQTSLTCINFPEGTQIPIPSSNTLLSAIAAGDNFLCSLSYPSLTYDNSIDCWRFSGNSTDLTSNTIYQGAMLDDFQGGSSHICGIINNPNSLVCWQWHGFNSSNAKDLWKIAVGQEFVCGLLTNGEIKCFGTNNSIVGKEPTGNYTFIAAGPEQACAISMDNTLVDCWGKTPVSHLSGCFNSLALGNNSGCAIRDNYTVFCWGENNFALPESLQGVFFLSITGKSSVFCGVIMRNYSLICWDSENLNSTSLVFQSVMPGPCQTQCQCGIFPDYGLFCDQGFICLPCLKSSAGLGLGQPTLYPPASSPPLSGQSSSSISNSTSNNSGLIELIVGCVGVVAWISVFGFFLFKYCKRKVYRVHDTGPLHTTTHHQQGSAQIHTPEGSSFGPPKGEKRLIGMVSMGSNKLESFPLEELRQATDNFSDGHKIGCGSYGSVYRATLLDGREVAIKRAEVTSSTSPLYACSVKRQEDKEHAFISELSHLSRLNHKNLVQLYGYCDQANERVLVYEFMVNGTLHDHLHHFNDSPIMSWPTRIKVALDAARGIEYLHTWAVPQIIHRDIKSSNILLNDQWIAKVSDFGLSLMGPDDEDAHLSLRAAGTVGYMDPAYYKFQQLTTKSDVYSFGVVLLELLSGHKAIHRNEETGLPTNVVHNMVPYIIRDEIHRVLDPRLPLPTPCQIEAVAYVGYLAADCVVADGRDRPTMTEIVDSLERALDACLAKQNPFLSRSTTGSSIGE
ncbi:hypothetical protein NE237_016476 [Protea cynaroides]|uniref:Protein kinase domain-containing protein n=1 Tax=Protea cynaroides TaxID=273540 RepID=A0A9Q0HDX4_9MAGN|nr:hypothetical protein NE237_016476 [Protea cynaroides]